MSIPGDYTYLTPDMLATGTYFWGVVDETNTIKVDPTSNTPLFFMTRSQARAKRKVYGGTVRKVYTQLELRYFGGA